MAYISQITPLGSSESYDIKARIVETPGLDVMLKTSGSSSNDSGDIVFYYGDNTEKARIWTANEYTAKSGPNYRVYSADGTNLYSGNLVLGDGTGASGTWGISITGNAATATKLATARTISLTGAVTGSGSFDGSGNLSITTTTATTNHNHFQLVTEGDNRSVATTPDSYSNNLVFRGLKTNSAFGSPSSDTYSYVVGLRGWQDASGGNAYELAFNNTGIYSRNGSTTSWNGWQRLATSSDLSSYVLKAGDTMSGTLHFKNITTDNYTQGIRLHPSTQGWNAITFCGTDNTGDSGTSTNTWGLFTHNGNFYIGKNGCDDATTFLRNVNGVWYWNGTAIGNASSANDISTGTPVLATATESNAITVIDLGNNVPATDKAQRHALDFKWYNSHWAIGNLRTGTSTSAGFGFSYSPDGTNWANKLIIGTNGSITIGHRETATSPSSATSSTRLTIIPYFHIGGPWTINSVDDSTNAYLTIKYGSSQITSLRHDGYMTAVRVYGAVWNDYAEYRKDNPNENQEPGRCVKELGNGALALTTKRLERGCEIISDTFGFAIGQDEENGYNTPIASNGRVLAYPYESIEEFAVHIGWPVCSGPNGTVSIMTEEEEEKYPSRIIGTISEIPTYEEWGTGSVKVNGRVWIRIR